MYILNTTDHECTQGQNLHTAESEQRIGRAWKEGTEEKVEEQKSSKSMKSGKSRKWQWKVRQPWWVKHGATVDNLCKVLVPELVIQWNENNFSCLWPLILQINYHLLINKWVVKTSLSFETKFTTFLDKCRVLNCKCCIKVYPTTQKIFSQEDSTFVLWTQIVHILQNKHTHLETTVLNPRAPTERKGQFNLVQKLSTGQA